MCGICGYISKTEIDKGSFERITDSLSHRGPDDRGIWLAQHSDTYVSLGHRRLSVLDLSSAGHQPMGDESGRYHIVFNGEIYNYYELRKRVSEYRLKSDTDTEVLLYLYIKYGVSCLDLINGMFAFAIYDNSENKLFMARDRMGKKPLYYYYGEGLFIFASELKAIMLFPEFKRDINKSVLVQYFSQNCIIPPNTIFIDTFKLQAGEYLIWKDGAIESDIYYTPMESFVENNNRLESDYSICKYTVKKLLCDSIEKRMIADVPVGTFLSGGIDSTLVTAIAADIAGNKGIDTFSIGFKDKRYDESIFAASSADYLGTRHHEKMMSEEDLFEVMTDLTTYYDEPFSDSSQLSTMLVSKFARENVTVVLSGDGGDELFAGYSNIDTVTKLRKYDPIISFVRTITPNLIRNMVTSDSIRVLTHKMYGIEKVQYYAKIRESFAKKILKNNQGNGIIRDNRIHGVLSWQQKRMLLDLMYYLPDEIMTKADRASMRYSLELRCPILDYRIVDYSMRIPLEYKYRNGIKKYILKDILYDYIPKEMMDRPKKGFSVPIYRWLNNELSGKLSDYMDQEFLDEQGIFNHDCVKELYKLFLCRDESSTTQLMWSYYVFQLWYEKYIISGARPYL